MTTIQKDLLTGREVLFAASRAERPDAFILRSDDTGKAPCPFCPGNEHETPPELMRVGSASQWSVRVVPNRYPAVDLSSENGGSHEVIIESPNHDARFESLDRVDAAEVLGVYMTRFRKHWENPETESVILFKNQGPLAGSSIPHLHSQLLGLNWTPERAVRERGAFREAAAEAFPCPLCAVLGASSGQVIAESESFVAVTPIAARGPYQLRVIPRHHTPSMAGLSGVETSDLAAMLQRLVAALNSVLGTPDYNWTFQNAPRQSGRVAETFHWYVEITPRVTVEAGFELATGVIINIVDPIEAAARLRQFLRKG